MVARIFNEVKQFWPYIYIYKSQIKTCWLNHSIWFWCLISKFYGFVLKWLFVSIENIILYDLWENQYLKWKISFILCKLFIIYVEGPKLLRLSGKFPVYAQSISCMKEDETFLVGQHYTNVDIYLSEILKTYYCKNIMCHVPTLYSLKKNQKQ